MEITLNGSAQQYIDFIDAALIAEGEHCRNCGHAYHGGYDTLDYRITLASVCCWCPICRRVTDHLGECFTVNDLGEVIPLEE